MQAILNFFGFFKQPESKEEAKVFAERQEKLDALDEHLKEAQGEMRDAAGWVPFLSAASDISYGAIEKDNTNVVMGMAGIVVDAVPGGKDAKTLVNIAKNAKKMSIEEIGKFLKAGIDWHKGSAKKDFLKMFKKELKGDTNADFYIDKSTKDVYLKSNKSGNWINTGQKLD